MNKTGFGRTAKVVTLATLLLSCNILGVSCTGQDVMDNIVAGALGYVKSETTSILNSLITADDVLGSDLFGNVLNNGGE